MSFKLKVTGFDQLDASFKALARQISPQVGLADALEDGAWVIVLQARDNVVEQGLIDAYELHDSILPRKINQYRVDVKVGVPYGAAHEFGVTVTITPKQRAFFWAKWYETRDPMWKALALSVTYTIPARPYLRPAYDERKDVAIVVTSRSIAKQLKEAL